MTRIRNPLVLAAAGAALVATAATAATAAMAGAPAANAASTATVKVASTGVGKILVDKSGFTLYMFTRDKHGKDSCVKVSGCTSLWPLYTTKGKPVAGPGVKRSLLGTIKVSGREQVTYAGDPLYTYVADSEPKQTSYVGVSEFGGYWYALSAAGKIVK